MPKPTAFVVSPAKYLLKEKRFLLAAVGVFAVFTLLTAPLFSMIAYTGGYIHLVNDYSWYYLTQQASAQEQSIPFTPFSQQQEAQEQEAVPEDGGQLPTTPTNEIGATNETITEPTLPFVPPSSQQLEQEAVPEDGGQLPTTPTNETTPTNDTIELPPEAEEPGVAEVVPQTNQTIAPPLPSEPLQDPIILLNNITTAIAPTVEPLLQNLTQEGVVTANQAQTISSAIDRFQTNPNSNISSVEATEICDILVDSTEPSTVEGIVDVCESPQKPQAFLGPLIGAIIGWIAKKVMDAVWGEVSLEEQCTTEPIPSRNGGGCCPGDRPYWNSAYETCTYVPPK